MHNPSNFMLGCFSKDKSAHDCDCSICRVSPP